jgi:CheY-like chemotaxis protein
LISTILVVDDDRLLAYPLAKIIEKFDTEFWTFTGYDVQTAFKIAHGIHPDLGVTAAIMPNSENLSHALAFRDEYGCKVLLMSAIPETAELLDRLEEAGKEPFDIFPKPTSPPDVIKNTRHLPN